MALFETGTVTFTPAAYDLIGPRISMVLRRHRKGDWGDLSEFDRQQNQDALKTGARLFSSYDLPEGKVWVITDGDDDEGVRHATTILLPSDY